MSMRSIALAALACAACEGFAAPPEPLVSVLRLTSDDCFAVMTPDTPVATVLGIQDICTGPSVGPMLVGGIDFVEVVVDYGPGVEFASDVHAPAPTVELLVDGVPSDAPIMITGEERAGARAYFIATFRAPATPSLDARVIASVNPGFQTEVPIAFSIVSPQLTIDITDCAQGAPCVLLGAVGNAHVRVAVPGDVSQTVVLSATLDGVAQPEPAPPVKTDPVGGHTEHTTAIPVPAARDGAQWVIAGQLGDAVPSTVTATIQAPTIDTSLSCDPSCSIAAGDTVGLDIAAPALIRPLQALVTTRLGGVPQLVDATVALVAGADGNARGTLALVAPQAGAWTIDVTIAGYSAPTLVETVR